MNKLVFLLLLASVICSQLSRKRLLTRKQTSGSVIGKTVVLCRDSELLAPLRTATGRLDWNASLPHTSFNPFTAAKITEAEIHSETHSGDWGSYTLAFLVTLSNDKQGILVGELNQIYADERGKGLLLNALQSAVTLGNLLLDLPTGLKDGDTVTVQRGMKETTARCLLGNPDADNDYGIGGQQLVFNGGA